MSTTFLASANSLTLIFAALLLSFCAATDSQAQSQISNAVADWNNVKALKVGQRVIVTTKTGETVKGFVNKPTDAAIVIVGKKQLVTVDRENVRQINLAKKSGALGVALGIAGGVGGFFGGAYLTAALILNSDLSENAAALIGLPVIIGATAGGAVLGNKIGSRYRKSKLIYRSN